MQAPWMSWRHRGRAANQSRQCMPRQASFSYILFLRFGLPTCTSLQAPTKSFHSLVRPVSDPFGLAGRGHFLTPFPSSSKPRPLPTCNHIHPTYPLSLFCASATRSLPHTIPYATPPIYTHLIPSKVPQLHSNTRPRSTWPYITSSTTATTITNSPGGSNGCDTPSTGQRGGVSGPASDGSTSSHPPWLVRPPRTSGP